MAKRRSAAQKRDEKAEQARLEKERASVDSAVQESIEDQSTPPNADSIGTEMSSTDKKEQHVTGTAETTSLGHTKDGEEPSLWDFKSNLNSVITSHQPEPEMDTTQLKKKPTSTKKRKELIAQPKEGEKRVRKAASNPSATHTKLRDERIEASDAVSANASEDESEENDPKDPEFVAPD